jgi:hypothetical protein
MVQRSCTKLPMTNDFLLGPLEFYRPKAYILRDGIPQVKAKHSL